MRIEIHTAQDSHCSRLEPWLSVLTQIMGKSLDCSELKFPSPKKPELSPKPALSARHGVHIPGTVHGRRRQEMGVQHKPDLRLDLVSVSRGWAGGNDSVGKSICGRSMRTLLRIHGIHVNSWARSPTCASPTLAGGDRLTKACWLPACLQSPGL